MPYPKKINRIHKHNLPEPDKTKTKNLHRYFNQTVWNLSSHTYQKNFLQIE